MRDLLFHRDFRGYSGGHGKVFDYFRHACAHAGTLPRIHFTRDSVGTDNPWHRAGVVADAEWNPDAAGALFLGGMDWLAVPGDRNDRPVINLVQHVRHADPAQPLRAFLSRRAVRICVSAPVAAAIEATGEVNGPVIVIDAGLELPARARAIDQVAGRIFIAAAKQPELGRAVAARLADAGHDVDLCVDWTSRAAFLDRLGAAERAVMLPFATEGFFLPGLEAMALGCASVVPDCVGNRGYLAPGVNALAPALDADAVLGAVIELDDPVLRVRLADAGRATAARFDLARERRLFHAVLDDLEALWRS
jgi:glycosyltransferase involved in cell wall biosynthesis